MKILFLIIAASSFLSACHNEPAGYAEVNSEADIHPDYSGVTIPPNIAPLNFTINEDAVRYLVKIHPSDGPGIFLKSGNRNIRIPSGKWKKLICRCTGGEMVIEIFILQGRKWIKYRNIVNRVAKDSVDSHLVYRLIDPVFKGWGKMGIYQRCLENFDETPVFRNNLSEGNCMNCHNFCMNSTRNFLFHMRGKIAGTVIFYEGDIKWVNTKTDSTLSAGVYPSWHPDGKYIVFSVNHIVQRFHAVYNKKIEVIDTLSDLILYDVGKNMVSSCNSISSEDRFETFPCWSPDGRSLFFCSARALPVNDYNKIRYDLLRVSFNPENQNFGECDTVISSSASGWSISFPRVSPDGKYLLFTVSPYGNFSIWHKESDLYIMDLETREIIKPDLNSESAESYHSWSSNGRWIVFSTRRDDGLFTKPYLSYFDRSGKAHKPFLLPQKNPEFYKTFLKSFNIPEFTKSSIDIKKRELYKIIRTKPSVASFSD